MHKYSYSDYIEYFPHGGELVYVKANPTVAPFLLNSSFYYITASTIGNHHIRSKTHWIKNAE